MNLTSVCAELCNYFAPLNQKTSLKYIHHGTFTIKNNTVSGTDFLLPEQYFRIVGSVLNDGVYQNNPDGLSGLKDENFIGSVWEMAVPSDFISLCEEIEKFNIKLNEFNIKNKGFQSEAFTGVYSYTMPSGIPAYMSEWQKSIKSRLNNYRRISIL